METTKHIALYWSQVPMAYVTVQKTNYKDAQKTHDHVTCEEVDGNGKDGVDYEEGKLCTSCFTAGNKDRKKYDKILTVVKSGGDH